MTCSQADRDIVRRLAEEYAAIAALPIQRERAAEWTRLNDLVPGRPLLWINELPWQELNFNDELTLLCQDAFCQGVEWELRSTLYQWRHLPGDMVIEPVLYSNLVIHDTGFGIQQEGEVIIQEGGALASQEFDPQITCEADIEKIKTPIVTHDIEASEANFQRLVALVGDLVPVRKRGIATAWFAPWDELIRWWGVQPALMDMVERPELVHLGMDRLVNAYLARLDQWVEQNLLSLPEGNYRVGSGGYAYTSDLPAADFDPARVRPLDQWGHATPQIFSTVSPAMHEEFALQYERRWLERFGLTYYGCCEPLDVKLGILASVPNLRKVSMSPWASLASAFEQAGGKYVFSHKPNPAVLAEDRFRPEIARQFLSEALEQCRGCPVEVILKDVSTVRGDPQRLWTWAELAREVCEEFG